MTYKHYNSKAFAYLESVGMRIPSIGECSTKTKLGAKIGIANLATVFFGLYAVKVVNIPM